MDMKLSSSNLAIRRKAFQSSLEIIFVLLFSGESFSLRNSRFILLSHARERVRLVITSGGSERRCQRHGMQYSDCTSPCCILWCTVQDVAVLMGAFILYHRKTDNWFYTFTPLLSPPLPSSIVVFLMTLRQSHRLHTKGHASWFDIPVPKKSQSYCVICFVFLLLIRARSELFQLKQKRRLHYSITDTHEQHHEKTCFSHMRTTKTQISLRIRAVWSASLLFAD